MTTYEAAKALRKLAATTVSEGMVEWAGEPEMLAMVWADARAYREVAALLDADDVQGAQKALESMDTAPREYAYDALGA